MRKNNVAVIAAVVGVVLFFITSSREPARAQAQPAQKWEYKIVLLDNGADQDPRNNQAAFNKLGADGWELAAIHSATRPEYSVFKRPQR